MDQGQIDNAKLQLIYCRITAPIAAGWAPARGSGQPCPRERCHRFLVITQLQPITVVFPIAEDNLPGVLGGSRTGAQLRSRSLIAKQKRKLRTGTLLTIDNQVDPTTGTVRFKAIFANKNDELFPSQFVNAHLTVDVKVDATVVPASATQRGPRGTYVYVVKTDNTVTQRLIEMGETQRGLTVIRSGVAPGELVVVDGAERLRDGARVEVKVQADDTTPKGGR